MHDLSLSVCAVGVSPTAWSPSVSEIRTDLIVRMSVDWTVWPQVSRATRHRMHVCLWVVHSTFVVRVRCRPALSDYIYAGEFRSLESVGILTRSRLRDTAYDSSTTPDKWTGNIAISYCTVTNNWGWRTSSKRIWTSGSFAAFTLAGRLAIRCNVASLALSEAIIMARSTAE